MHMTHTYSAYIDPDVLAHHIRAIGPWSAHTQLPDPIDYRDHVETASDLARVWVRDEPPDSIEMFPYPKASGSLRQLAIVSPRDHARLRATSASVAEIAQRRLHEHCYSGKLATPPPNWNFKSNLYFKFVRAAIKGIKNWDCTGMVRTDVQGYFPSISIETLLRALWDSGCDKDSVLDIIQTLLTWQDTCKELRGLPIGPEACALLGTFFLDPVDVALGAHARAHYRYMDDIAYLYGPNLANDRGYGVVDQALATVGLTRSADKTKHAQTPAEAIDLMQRRDLAYVEAYVQRIPNVAIGPVKAFFNEAVMPSSPFDLPGLRKCLSAFLSAMDSHAVYPLLAAPMMFDADPKACANYLVKFASNSDVLEGMSSRMKSRLVPPASRVHMIRILAAGGSDRSTGQSLLAMAADSTYKIPERVWAAAAYGNSSAYQLNDLADALEGTPYEVRRAGILTVNGRRGRRRHHVARLLAKGSPALELSGDWALTA